MRANSYYISAMTHLFFYLKHGVRTALSTTTSCSLRMDPYTCDFPPHRTRTKVSGLNHLELSHPLGDAETIGACYCV